MDWDEFFDEKVQIKNPIFLSEVGEYYRRTNQVMHWQRAWERRRRVAWALNSGATAKEIANFLGLTEGTIHQLKNRFATSRAPILRYCEEREFRDWSEVPSLCKKFIRNLALGALADA